MSHYAILLDKAYRLSKYLVTIPPVDLLLLHRSTLQRYFFLSAGEITSIALRALDPYYKGHHHIVVAINDMPVKHEEYFSAAEDASPK